MFSPVIIFLKQNFVPVTFVEKLATFTHKNFWLQTWPCLPGSEPRTPSLARVWVLISPPPHLSYCQMSGPQSIWVWELSFSGGGRWYQVPHYLTFSPLLFPWLWFSHLLKYPPSQTKVFSYSSSQTRIKSFKLHAILHWLFEDQFLILGTFFPNSILPSSFNLEGRACMWDMLRCWVQPELPRRTQHPLTSSW